MPTELGSTTAASPAAFPASAPKFATTGCGDAFLAFLTGLVAEPRTLDELDRGALLRRMEAANAAGARDETRHGPIRS